MKKILIILTIFIVMCFAIMPISVHAETYNDYDYEEYSSEYSETEDNWYIPDGTSIVITIVIMGVTAVVLVVKHNKANRKISATAYVAKNGYNVHDRKERYVRTYETVQRGYYQQNNNKN